MKKYTQNKKIDKDTELLFEIMNKYQSARDYIKRGFLTTWDDSRKVYNSQRVKANYEGSSDTFVPETFTIIQSVKSNVVGGKIKIEFLPTTADQTGETKVLNSLMDQIWTEDRTKLKASWAIDDSLQVGNGYLWQYWDGIKPCNLYIPTEDNFFDPAATNYQNLRWGGYRYHTTKDALEAETKVNPDYDETDPTSKLRVPRFKNLDKIDEYAGIQGFKNYNDKTAKQLREEMIAGSVLTDKNENVVEVIVYYDKKRQIKIANRCVVIEDIETPFKREAQVIQSVDDMGNPVPFELPEIKPFIPVAPARDYVDGAMWYARGEVEVIKDLQELLNDTQNQKSDNLNFTLNRMWVLDPSQSHKKDEIQSVPGAVFTLPPGSLEPLTTPSIGVDADNEMYRIQKMMRSATAADEIVQGMKQQGTQTATQINSQLMQAGNRFASKLENYESEFFAILANNMFKILQIFLTQEQAVRIVGQSGVEWKNYNPGEYLGDWDVKVSLEANARQIKEERKQEAMQFFLMMSKIPGVDVAQLGKLTAGIIFDIDSNIIEKVLPEAQMQMAQQMQMQQMAAQTQQAQAEAQMAGMPQQGGGAMASGPQSNAENAVSAGVQQSAGLNIPGMVQG
jgi:hypothetical protein